MYVLTCYTYICAAVWLTLIFQEVTLIEIGAFPIFTFIDCILIVHCYKCLSEPTELISVNFWVSARCLENSLLDPFLSLEFTYQHHNNSTELDEGEAWWKEKRRKQDSYVYTFPIHVFNSTSTLAHLTELCGNQINYSIDERTFKSNQVIWLWFCSI